jgi:uncharacterized protein (DUF2384 family)
MMKAAPASAFILAKAQFLFKLLMVPSRQYTRRQAFLGKARASCLAETG